ERDLRGAAASGSAAVPPPVDRAVAALDLVRYEHDKRAFFADDVTARYLSERIENPPPAAPAGRDRRGSFSWVVTRLELRPVECFTLAVALLPIVDSAAGQVIACCLNDASRTSPTLALAQRLWDDPHELAHSFDPAHALLRHGLIGIGSDASSHDWQSSLAVPSLVASELLFGREQLPAAFAPIETIALPADFDRAAIARVAAAVAGDAASMRIVPVVGGVGAPLAEVAAACAQRAGGRTVRPRPGFAPPHLAP